MKLYKHQVYLLLFLLIPFGILLNCALTQTCIWLSVPLFMDCYGTVMLSLLGGYIPGMVVGFFTNLINGISDPITLYYGIISVFIAVAAAFLAKRGFFDKFRRAWLPITVFAFIGGVLGSCLTWLLYGLNIGHGISAPFAEIFIGFGIRDFWAQLIADVIIDIADKTIIVLLSILTAKLIPDSVLSVFPYAVIRRTAPIIPTHKAANYRSMSLRSKVTVILAVNSLVLSTLAVSISTFVYKSAVMDRYADSELITVQSIFIIKMSSLLFGVAIIIVMLAQIYYDSSIVRPVNRMKEITEVLAYDVTEKKLAGNKLLKETKIETGDELESLYNALAKMSSDTRRYIEQIESNSEYISYLQNGIIVSFADMVENRDLNTGEHIKRTASYVEIVARTLREEGKHNDILTERYINEMVRSAPLHDIGKIKIPDSILNKPDRLTEDEFTVMKTHPSAGKDILKRISDNVGENSYLTIASEMAACHHEWWNGKGYPDGLSGDSIPLSARIMAIADVFDALVSKRSYKKAFALEEAAEIIKSESGTHFDPEITEAFMKSKDSIFTVLKSFGNQ